MVSWTMEKIIKGIQMHGVKLVMGVVEIDVNPLTFIVCLFGIHTWRVKTHGMGVGGTEAEVT